MLSNIRTFLNKPFNEQGNALQWFCFIGFLIVSLYIWHMILRDAQRVEGAITGD